LGYTGVDDGADTFGDAFGTFLYILGTLL